DFAEELQFSEEELACWLVFSQMQGLKINDDQFKNILDRFEKLINLFAQNRRDLIDSRLFKSEVVDSFLSQKEKADSDKLMAVLKDKAVTALPFTHPLYPAKLRHIHNPPRVLYMKGRLDP